MTTDDRYPGAPRYGDGQYRGGQRPGGGRGAGGSTGGGHRASGRPSSHRARKKKRSRRARILRGGALGAGILMVVTIGGAYAYYEHLNGNIHHTPLYAGKSPAPSATANAKGQKAMNILLIGSDSRNSAEDVKLGGAKSDAGGAAHADVEMLLHVSADRSNASIISIPRDTVVQIPECTDPKTKQDYPAETQIITDSLGRGGPGCTVATWEAITKIPIDHYMMVDFAGVAKLATAVGGVPVCVNHNIDDTQIEYINGVKHEEGSHLKLTQGTHKIKGVQALEWLRTRHAFGDGSDNKGRTKAQHMYLSALMRQMKSGSTLTNPFKLNSLAETATHALTVDDGLDSVAKLVGLARDLDKVPTKHMTMLTVPNHPDPSNANHILLDDSASQIFEMIRDDIPLDKQHIKKANAKAAASASPTPKLVPKSTVKLAVRNGGTVPGRAAALTRSLVGAGFTQATVDATRVSSQSTTLTYPTGQKGAAETVAKYLNLPDSALQPSGSATSLTLVIGAKWTTGYVLPKSASSPTAKPKAGSIPTGSEAINASNTKECMQVNMAKYPDGKYIYSW